MLLVGYLLFCLQEIGTLLDFSLLAGQLARFSFVSSEFLLLLLYSCYSTVSFYHHSIKDYASILTFPISYVYSCIIFLRLPYGQYSTRLRQLYTYYKYNYTLLHAGQGVVYILLMPCLFLDLREKEWESRYSSSRKANNYI